MNLAGRSCNIVLVATLQMAVVVLCDGPVIAGDHGQNCSDCVSATRPATACAYPTTATLGTFEPTPYIMVRGNWPLGGGYSPLDIYGDQSLAIYGPLSPLRATTAPVRTYTRGYDGRIYAREGTSFSNPNLPRLSPFVYPTPANYYYGPRVNRTPPWWSSGINWIDQQ
jgi:hypothetical protein